MKYIAKMMICVSIIILTFGEELDFIISDLAFYIFKLLSN